MAAYIKAGFEDFILIGNTYDPESKRVTGDARFYIDLQTAPLAVAVDIDAAIYIPMLKSYGYVTVEVNSTAGSFEGEISIFDGILKPYAKVEWLWDFSYFYLELEQIILARGLILLNHVELEADPRQLALDFHCELTVLFIANLEASFSIDGLDEGESLDLIFNRQVEISGISSYISVNATLDTENIEDSQISVFEISVAEGFFYLNGRYSDGLLSGEFEVPILTSHGFIEIKAESDVDWYVKRSGRKILLYLTPSNTSSACTQIRPNAYNKLRKCRNQPLMIFIYLGTRPINQLMLGIN